MTMTDHLTAPPPELVQQWFTEADNQLCSYYDYIATQAAHWGADQELEACCADIHTVHGQHRVDWLRAQRRPKPPSLKEQALETLRQMHIDPETGVSPTALDTIRRALEQLND